MTADEIARATARAYVRDDGLISVRISFVQKDGHKGMIEVPVEVGEAEHVAVAMIQATPGAGSVVLRNEDSQGDEFVFDVDGAAQHMAVLAGDGRPAAGYFPNRDEMITLGLALIRAAGAK